MAENRSNYSSPVIAALGVLVLVAAFFHILVPVLFTIVTAIVASRDAIMALPFLWVAYWPLAGILIAVSSGIACVSHRY